jgi:FAD synthetase|tara:strand:+ start:4723 stop:5133 length:411 start_codon:yes stop_codon:yes gene_type:complete
MTKVITFGSFDILHEGHKNYLREAKSYGDYLIVVVARDGNIVRIKHNKPKNDENSRLENIKNLDFVDEAVLGNENDIFQVLEEYKPDIICLGYDQKTATEEIIKQELEKRNLSAEIIRCKAFKPEVYKSSKLNGEK